MFSDRLKGDYAYCEKIIKEASKSFYFAFSKLPKEKARAIYAIYAFNRVVDDSVDEEEDRAVQKSLLDQHRYNLLNKSKIDTPIYRALTDTFRRFQSQDEPYLEQIQGQEMDLDFQQPETLADLENYSDYVAGSVGRMMLPIIASDHDNYQDLYPAAQDLGVAMQLTNILRDVGEDYRERRRIYLPKDLMKRFGYSEEDLALNRINENFIAVWEAVAQRSEELYRGFLTRLEEFDADSRKPIEKSAKVYHEILEVVREKDYNCLTERQYVPKKRMLSL